MTAWPLRPCSTVFSPCTAATVSSSLGPPAAGNESIQTMARRHAFRYSRAPRNDICAFPIPGNEKTGPGMQTLVTDFD